MRSLYCVRRPALVSHTFRQSLNRTNNSACGDKVIKHIPCHRTTKPSCGKPCTNVSSCGHKCGRFCHDPPCIDDTHPCVSKCGRTLSCGHLCKRACHTDDCELTACNERVVLRCPCGLQSKAIICGAMQSPLLECNSDCEKHAKAIKMKLAFDIKESGNMHQWPPELVSLAQLFPTLVLDVERQLESLVRSKKTFLYYPRQKVNKANLVIKGIAEMYGFHAEVVDANSGKPNVIISKLKDRRVFIPPVKLSACKPVVTAEASNLVVEKPKSNGIWFDGVPKDISNDAWIEKLRTLDFEWQDCCVYWVDDAQVFLMYTLPTPEVIEPTVASTEGVESSVADVAVDENPTEEGFEIIESIDSIELEPKPQEKPKPSVYETLIANMDSGWFAKAQEILVSPMGVVRFQDGSSFNIKKKNSHSFRLGNLESGWNKSIGSWKLDGTKL